MEGVLFEGQAKKPRLLGIVVLFFREETQATSDLPIPVHYDGTPAFLDQLCKTGGWNRQTGSRLQMINAWLPLRDSPGSETIALIPASAQTPEKSEIWTDADDPLIDERPLSPV